MKLKTGLWVLLPLAIAVAYCDGTNKITVPDNEKPVIDPSNRIGEIRVLASPTPDPTATRSYITFKDGCAGTWCAVRGSSNKVSIIATIPGRNDKASIYGEWFVTAEYGKCVDFPSADNFIRIFTVGQPCGDVPIQCDASLGYIGGVHVGHILTTINNCIDPSPTPSPSPSPTPTPTPTPSPTPTPTPTPSPTPTPNPLLCYYRVSCGEQSDITLTRECTDQQQKNLCEAKVGYALDHGIWLNFVQGALHNHCQFNVPGVIDRDFQLNPGQSDPNCYDKNTTLPN